MTSWATYSPAQTYVDILSLNNDPVGQGLTITLTSVQDGNGVLSPMQISSNAVNFTRTGGSTFQLDGVALTASASYLNLLTSSNPAFVVTSALGIALGTTAERPVTPTYMGSIRYNTETNQYEFYQGASWKQVITSAIGDDSFTGTVVQLNQLTLANPVVVSTGALGLPSGTTAQRPGSPVGGDIRYNSQDHTFEGYIQGTGWRTFDMV